MLCLALTACPSTETQQPVGAWRETPVGDGLPIVSVDITVSERAKTVVTVAWRTAEPSTGWVALVDPGTLPPEIHSPGDDPATDHEVMLKGLRAGTSYSFRVYAQIGEAGWFTGELSTTTGPLPASLPELTVSAIDPSQAAGGYEVRALITPTDRFPVILDTDGHYVWYYTGTPALSSTRAILSQDRSSILIGGHCQQGPCISRVPFDGEGIVRVDAPALGIDFAEVEAGRYAYLSAEIRPFADGTRQLSGGTIELVGEDGEQRRLWSAFDWFTPDLQLVYTYTGEDVDGVQVEEWTHYNYLEHDPHTHSLLSTDHNGKVIRVDPGSGDLLWELSNHSGDFDTGEDVLVMGPHSAQLLPDSVLVFNQLPQDGCSQADEIHLDTENGDATGVWTYASEACMQVYLLGQAQRLDAGNTVVTWSTSGQIDEVTPEGELVWRLNTAVGTGIGYGQRLEELY